MPSEPKLWAVFGPHRNRITDASEDEFDAWWFARESRMPDAEFDEAVSCMKKLGYTCREVRIVPVDEVGT